MYVVGDTHSHMSPVGDDGGEEDLWHVRSGGSVTHVPSGGWGVTHVPSGGRDGGGEKRICVMYAVGDAQ